MNALQVINVNNALLPNARDSMVAAAQRWQCELVERFAPPANSEIADLHPACWKTEALELAQVMGHARVLVLDADCVISAECPDPFQTFESRKLVVVSDRQTNNPARDQAEDAEWALVSESGGKARPRPEFFFNSGFLLASVGYHLHLFARATALCRKFPHLAWHDQTPFNVACHGSALLCPAAFGWNFHNPETRLDHWEKMTGRPSTASPPKSSWAYIYHFPGNPARGVSIEKVRWQHE